MESKIADQKQRRRALLANVILKEFRPVGPPLSLSSPRPHAEHGQQWRRMLVWASGRYVKGPVLCAVRRLVLLSRPARLTYFAVFLETHFAFWGRVDVAFFNYKAIKIIGR